MEIWNRKQLREHVRNDKSYVLQRMKYFYISDCEPGLREIINGTEEPIFFIKLDKLERIIGMAMVRDNSMHYISVDHYHKRKGIAREIIETMYAWASENDYPIFPSSFTNDGRKLIPIFDEMKRIYPHLCLWDEYGYLGSPPPSKLETYPTQDMLNAMDGKFRSLRTLPKFECHTPQEYVDLLQDHKKAPLLYEFFWGHDIKFSPYFMKDSEELSLGIKIG